MTLQELREKQAAAIKTARDLQDKADREKRDMTGDESATADKALKDAADIGDQIKGLARNEERKATLSRFEAEQSASAGRRTDADDPENRGSAGNRGTEAPGRRGREGSEDRPSGAEGLAWRQRHSGRERNIAIRGQATSPEHREAYARFLASGRVSPVLSRSHSRDAESRDLAADSEADGGYLVAPLQMVGGILKFIDDMVYIRQFATVIPVTNAQSAGQVSLDADPDDGDWTSEVATGTADTGMKFGMRELNPNPVAKRIKLSRKLLRCTPNVESLVTERLAYKFGITMEKQFMTGDGAKKPLGLFTASSFGISTARDVSTDNTTTAIKADNLIRVKMSLKAQYRNRASTRWIFHRNAMEQVQLLKDSNGQYLWRQGLVGGEPDTLLGIAVSESEYAPNTFTTGKYVGILGDLSFYYIAEALQLDIQRINELYAETNQIGFIGRMEADGMPALEEAFARVKLG